MVRMEINMDTGTWLSICTVAGIGESNYTAVRFEYYTIEENRLFVPDTEIDNPPCRKENYSLTGQDILVSLYNLFDDINYRKNKKGHIELIGEWCKKHIHPYNINELSEHVPDIADYEKMLEQPNVYCGENSPRKQFQYDTKFLVIDGTFEISKFMRDLELLYFTVKTYHAIMALKDGDSTVAKELAKEGRYCDGRSYTSRDLLSGELDTTEKMNSLCEYFEAQKMELKYDQIKKEFTFVPKVNSVFDIAWYALIRHIISDAASSSKDQINYTLFRCKCCGRLFTPTCNRQKYCADTECQYSRKRKNSKDFYNRKKYK